MDVRVFIHTYIHTYKGLVLYCTGRYSTARYGSVLHGSDFSCIVQVCMNVCMHVNV